ncbi:MAG: hypothetical protein R3A47_06835 [Polyangiales bacterium]
MANVPSENTSWESSDTEAGFDGERYGLTALSKRDPEVLGRYRLCFQIASGGMATVYLARAQSERIRQTLRG